MADSPSEFIDWKKRLENVENKLHLKKPYFKSVYEKKKKNFCNGFLAIWNSLIGNKNLKI